MWQDSDCQYLVRKKKNVNKMQLINFLPFCPPTACSIQLTPTVPFPAMLYIPQSPNKNHDTTLQT